MPDVSPRGTAAKRAKPKRQAMPGGAPVARAAARKRSPTRTNPRRSASAARAPKAPKAKAPCKYGPRDAEGKCPKKPRSTRSTRTNPTRVTSRTAEGAAEQAIKVLTNPRATGDQKSAAITQVGTTIVTDAARKTVRKKRTAIIDAVKKHGSTVAGVVIPAYVALKAAQQIPKQRERESRRFADKELEKTKKRMGAQWRDDQAETLWKQYYQFALKLPVKNSFLGK